MTSEQKQQIYSLLKTASDSILGYKSKSFDENAPFFKDDEKIQLQEKQQPQQKIQPQENTKSSNQILPQSMQNVIEKIAQCSRCAFALPELATPTVNPRRIRELESMVPEFVA